MRRARQTTTPNGCGNNCDGLMQKKRVACDGNKTEHERDRAARLGQSKIALDTTHRADRHSIKNALRIPTGRGGSGAGD